MKKRLYNEYSAETSDANFIGEILAEPIRDILTHAKENNLCLRDCLASAQMTLINEFSFEILQTAMKKRKAEKFIETQ